MAVGRRSLMTLSRRRGAYHRAFRFRRLLRLMVDVLLPTRAGPVIRARCVGRPTDQRVILLHRLGLNLPTGLEITTM